MAIHHANRSLFKERKRIEVKNNSNAYQFMLVLGCGIRTYVLAESVGKSFTTSGGQYMKGSGKY